MILSKLPYLRDLARRRAAKKEVIAEFRVNPFGGYGLYHLMNDVGLLTESALDELEPLIANVERRLELSDEELVIDLPLKFEPLTDEEQDTLTYVIGQALRRFAETFGEIESQLRFAEIAGINDMLARHKGYTASIKHEINLEEILFPILQHCGKKISYESLVDASGGIYMVIDDLPRGRRHFDFEYLRERRLKNKEVVKVYAIIRKGYLQVIRLNYRSFYTKEWFFHQRNKLPKNNKVAAVYYREGQLYHLNAKYRESVEKLSQLYVAHMTDNSYDSSRYRPLRNQGASDDENEA